MNWFRCWILGHNWAWFKELSNGCNQEGLKPDGEQRKICKRCNKMGVFYL